MECYFKNNNHNNNNHGERVAFHNFNSLTVQNNLTQDIGHSLFLQIVLRDRKNNQRSCTSCTRKTAHINLK